MGSGSGFSGATLRLVSCPMLVGGNGVEFIPKGQLLDEIAEKMSASSLGVDLTRVFLASGNRHSIAT
jgi:hypothetical protein